jgi:hypothetical protein
MYFWSWQARDWIQEPFVDKHSIAVVNKEEGDEDWNCPPPGTTKLVFEDIRRQNRADRKDLNNRERHCDDGSSS